MKLPNLLVLVPAIGFWSGFAVAAETPAAPERGPGWLRHTYYDDRLLPKIIEEENARRHAHYLAELQDREDARLAHYAASTNVPAAAAADRLPGWGGQIAALRENLVASLGVHGPSSSFELVSTRLSRWMSPIRTAQVEVEGQSVPRNISQRRGYFEEIRLRSPVGGVTALLVRGRQLQPPYRTVVCLPDVDPVTGLAGGPEELIGAPQAQSLIEAGFLVAAVDLQAMAELDSRRMKQAFLVGEPPLGRIAAQLSVLISYLRTRPDLQGDRIAVSGRGLGGFAAALSAAVDTRIWATIVEDGLRSYRRIAGHGAELEVPWLVPRMLQYADAPDLVALIAPRPLLMIETGPTEPAWSSNAIARRIAEACYPPHAATGNFLAIDSAETGAPAIVRDFMRRHLTAPPSSWEAALPSFATSPPPPLAAPPVAISEIRTPEEWTTARLRVLEGVRRLLGGFPDRGADHSGQIIERGREDGFTWERVFVRTTPDTLTPVLITRSENVRTPAPALIHISGSSISYEDDALRLAPEMAVHGFIGVFACLKSATSFRLGGTPKDALGVVEGRPLLGEWAWNLMGLVDYLETRPDIDRHRIGAMGWSLGATTITYLLPFDERIKAGAGFVAFFQLKGMWDAVLPPGHPGGEAGLPFLERHHINSFVPGILRVGDVDDLLATMAPRPLLSLAGEQDDYFPIASVRDAHERIHRLYTLLGVPERVELLTYPGPHALAPPLREKAWEFFGRWLR